MEQVWLIICACPANNMAEQKVGAVMAKEASCSLKIYLLL
jgi:hypothetical protein